MADGTPKKKIAVMTSGGDAPGMNGTVRAVVRMAIHMGCDAYCVYEGYEGLVRGGDLIRKMEWQDVRGWLNEGGTLIGTARCKAFYERAGRIQAAKNMVLHGIDALIICGGDGSLTGADKFRSEWPGLLDELVAKGELDAKQTEPYSNLNIVGIVGSIDNDLSGTDSTIGCYTALECICDMVSRLETTARSHQRAFVVEVMGRHCGWLALMAGVAVGADYIFIPEKPSPDWKGEMRTIIQKNRELGKRKSIIIVAEGALDINGEKVTSKMVENYLAQDLGIESRCTNPGHSQRGGPAVAYDRLISTLQGVEAVKAVLSATPGSETCYVAMEENNVVLKPLMKAVQDTKDAAQAIADKEFDKALSLRDHEFGAQYKSFLITTNVMVPEEEMLPVKSRMRIGFINVGAPAGGVNAAIRAATAYCLRQGHTPIAIYNGFSGFVRHHADEPLGSVRVLDWTEVDEWASAGGSQIGTNRYLPEELGLETVANLIEKYQFDGLMFIGGFEAFTALSQLRKARSQFPSLCIPMVLLPAGISNNIPGSEWSIGSDTALNNLVAYCDTISQSASSSRRRVFVVETQGGRCGYLATVGGLAVGAMAVYTPEEGMYLDMLFSDIKHLTSHFSKDHGESRGGRLVLINEKASNTYNAEMISNIIEDEAGGRFSSRHATPGHFQQGNRPSGLDRCRAVRLAIKCIEHLETYGHCAHNRVKQDEVSCSTIGIKGSEVVFTPMKKLEEEDTNWKDRCGKSIPWMSYKEYVDILGGRPPYPKR